MKKANPKTVGGFVVGAVLLGVAAVMVFGGGWLFADRETFVAFFPGSLMGLRLGASVDMRGIQVGTVTDLWVEVDPETLEFTMPVLITLDYTRFRGVVEEETREDADGSDMPKLIERGFRAQLAAQSLVTGQQSVQLDFHPNTEVRLVETNLPHTQFPTIPSTMEQVEAGLGDIVTRASTVLGQMSELLSDANRVKVGQAIDNVADATGEVEKAVTDLRDVLTNIASIVETIKADVPRYQHLIDTADQTLVSYKALAERADGMLAANEDGVKKAITGLRQAEGKISALADRATKLIEANQKGIGDFTGTGLYELTNLAVDAQAAAEQFRRVMEEMERDPARFFLGRPGQVEVQ